MLITTTQQPKGYNNVYFKYSVDGYNNSIHTHTDIIKDGYLHLDNGNVKQQILHMHIHTDICNGLFVNLTVKLANGDTTTYKGSIETDANLNIVYAS